MSKRQPEPPPTLPGFTFVDVLGSGGFADVYLFQQQMPRRRVAVKVLLPSRIADGSAEQFAAEANVMALLSTHPAIVTIYQAGVSDDGRPYLVMEYCPRPNLQVRSRAAPFSVAEALRVGVQVAAAVETAHRAGILHRDIKPANILVTEYNRPALTDFGIATSADAVADNSGMSIPWSPPESFGDVPESGVRSDVWALGATVYTLLAGRSPFEVPGGRNGGAELIRRIETEPLPALDRTDVPLTLREALGRAMSKRAADRFESAIAFARALQRAQIELAQSVTPVDILDDAPPEGADDDAADELTRVRGIVSISPHTHPAAGSTQRRSDDPRSVPPGSSASSGASGSPVPPGSAASPGPPAAEAAPASYGPPASNVSPASYPSPASYVSPGPPAPDGGPASSVPPAASGWTGSPGSELSPISELEATALRTSAVDATVRRPSASAPTGPAPAAPGAATSAAAPAATSPAPSLRPRRGRLWVWLAVGLTVLIVAVVVGVTFLGGGARPEPTSTASVVPQNPIEQLVPAPSVPVGTAAGDRVTFTWTNPDPQDGDTYLWYSYTLTAEGAPDSTTETSVTVPLDPSGDNCIAVRVVRSDGRAGEESRGCAP